MVLFWNLKGNSCSKPFHQIYSQEPVNLKKKIPQIYSMKIALHFNEVEYNISFLTVFIIEMYSSAREH
jgi:hypothetical protein